MFYIESGVLIAKGMAVELVEKNSPIQIQWNLHIRACNFLEVLMYTLLPSVPSFLCLCVCFKSHGSDPCNPGARFGIS
jgi:hypothetical protein